MNPSTLSLSPLAASSNHFAPAAVVVLVVVLKVTALLALAAALAGTLRDRSAAVRHYVWALALGGAVALPFLTAAMPSLAVPILDAPAVGGPHGAHMGQGARAVQDLGGVAARITAEALGAPPDSYDTSVEGFGRHQSVAPPTTASRSAGDSALAQTSRPASLSRVSRLPHLSDTSRLLRLSRPPRPSRLPLLSRLSRSLRLSAITAPLLLALVWLGGCVAVLGWCVVGRVGLAWLARRATRVTDPVWRAQLDEVARRSGVRRRVRLLRSQAVGTPLTWGIIRPVVLLPSDAEGWSPARRRAVLRHELAHVARCDALTQLVAGVATALYWFHPLVWGAARRLRVESERACDDRVLAAGTHAADYAATLLDVARGAQTLRFSGMIAIGMARPSHLEGRLLAVLDDTRPRRTTSRRVRRAGAITATLVVGALAALHPEVRAASVSHAPAAPDGAGSETQTAVAGGEREVPALPSTARLAGTMIAPAAGTRVDGSINRMVARAAAGSGGGATAVPIASAAWPLVRAAPDTERRANTTTTWNTIAVSDTSTVITSSLPAGAIADSTFERSVGARPGQTLVLDLRTGGEVSVRGWDEPRVRVIGSLAGPDWRDTRVDLRRDGADVRLSAVYDGTRRTRQSSHRFEIRVPRAFDITINSAGGPVTIVDVDGTFGGQTGGGGFTLDHVRGSASLTTGGGEIRVTDSELRGTVSTGGGLVLLSGVRGGLKGYSGSGPVIHAEGGFAEGRAASPRYSMGRGGTTIDVSGNVATNVAESTWTKLTTRRGFVRPDQAMWGCPIIVVDGVRLEQDSTCYAPRVGRGFGSGAGARSRSGFGLGVDTLSGRLRIEQPGGDVTLGEVPNGVSVSTGGGRISIGRGAGLVEATTGGGDIEIGPIAGSVRAGTGAGEVRVTIADVRGEEQTVDVWSGSGRVIVELPSTFDGTLDLETAYTRSHGRATRIDAPWTLSREETSQWDDREGTPRRYVRAEGRVGAGSGRAYVKVRAVNGDIVVRRGR